jgi:hypothetical protein
MFEYVNYPWTSILSLAVLTFVVNAVCARDSADPFGNSSCLSIFEWVVLGIISLLVYGFTCVPAPDGIRKIATISFVNLSCSLVFFLNLLTSLGVAGTYFWKKSDGTKWYAKYCNQRKAKKEKDEVVETAENICGKMQLPTTAKAELGKALKEWKTVNKEIVPVKKLLAQHQEALAKVRKLQDEAWVHQSSVSDKDLKESYANTAKGLSDQCDELQKLVDEYKQQVDEKNTRIGELMKLFKKAKKDAESYKEYDKFTTEALEVQKELKETLLKAKKTK